MRLILCAKRDLHGCIFLNQLLPRLTGHETWILLSDKTRPCESAIPALSEMGFLERTLPLEFLFPILDRLPPYEAEFATFAGLERKFSAPTEIVADVNDPALVARLRAFAPHLIVSARFSHILQPATIDTARFGALNIHPGELPAYAGLFAPMRAAADGRQELACTMHFMDAGIDSGPIVAVERLPYRPGEGLLHRIADLYPLAIPPLLALLKRLERGEAVQGTPQDADRRRYRSMPDAAEVAAFLAAGHRFWDARAYGALLDRFLPEEIKP